jgi:murein DD-endopeptidase MepM/ murein hydrolase activator NlpD
MLEFGWPLDQNVIRGKTREAQKKNTFGMVRMYGPGKPKPHQGWDFLAENGTNCYAISDGVIKLIYESPDYGLVLVHTFKWAGKTYYAAFAHLSQTLKKEGDTVARGDLIGLTGSSGNAGNMPVGERHLHFEIRESARPGKGLTGRLSPWSIYEKVPWSPVPRIA